MTTLSQLVDKMVTELLRPDLLVAASTYANQTIRELHFRPNQNGPIRYDENRNEDEVDITTDGVFLWSIPKPSQFQEVEAIYIPELGIYVQPKTPKFSRNVEFQPYENIFWYRGGSTIAVSGVTSGWTMQISYFQYPRTLPYYTTANRIVVYDPETDTYKRSTGGTPTEEELDQATNWLLTRWASVIEEGVRSKMWKRAGDDGRARMSFGAYESMRAAIWNSEPAS